MTNEENTNEVALTLKRIGLFLKEKGVVVQPAPETSDVVETFIVDKKDLLKVCQLLKDDKDFRFDLLLSVSAVDKLDEGNFESVYHLFSSEYHHKVVIKVIVPRDKPNVPSVVPVWITADWHEREAYDLMGINYEGHPNLKRILMPDDWIGHPLRRDYVMNDDRLAWNKR